MRKINFLWVIVILMFLPISFISCSDDDKEGIGSASQLVGTWELVSFTYQYKENGKIIEEDTEETIERKRLTFHENGTWEVTEYDNGKWNKDEHEKGTWNYNNGKLTITYTYEDEDEDYSESLTVKELTNSKFVYEYTIKWSEGGIACEEHQFAELHKVSD